MNVEVIKIGSQVVIGARHLTTDLEGIVIAVCLRGNDSITYEVSWWDGRTHHCEWLSECEVAYNPCGEDRMTIGFMGL